MSIVDIAGPLLVAFFAGAACGIKLLSWAIGRGYTIYERKAAVPKPKD